MQEAAVIERTSPQPLRPAVSAWRLRIRDLSRQIVETIQAEAEPEAAYAAAREAAEDVTHATKGWLRADYGCTFDRLLDGTAVPHMNTHDAAGVLKLLAAHPGATLAELSMAFADRHDAATMIGIRNALTALVLSGKVRCDRHTFANRNKYFVAHS
jgi:hypothetical protein